MSQTEKTRVRSLRASPWVMRVLVEATLLVALAGLLLRATRWMFEGLWP
jgi:hypothetical protein